MHLVIHIVWTERCPKVRIYRSSGVVINGLHGLVGAWKKKDWRIRFKEVWDRDTRMDGCVDVGTKYESICITC